MINQSTLDKLIEMRLTAMADAFRIQMDNCNMNEIPFEDRFGMLVDIEYSNRKNNRLKRLIRSADVGRILRTFKIKKNVEVTDNGKIII